MIPIPFVEISDDTICAHCGDTLPDLNPEPGSWSDSGLCGARCALLHLVGRARWSDDATTGDARRDALRAIAEVFSQDDDDWDDDSRWELGARPAAVVYASDQAYRAMLNPLADESEVLSDDA